MKLTCLLIEKTCVDENWNPKGKDLYLRCSIQDYYIKFCESKVTKEDIVSRIDTTVTVEVEIVKGVWDDCVLGREGYYVRLLKMN